MPSACFVDTNVLLYTKDPTAPKQRARAVGWLAELARRKAAVISPQVMNEFAHNILRKFPQVSVPELVENLEALRPLCLAGMDDSTALAALAIHRRYRFSFYDSSLVATALAYGCDLFLSEDFSHNQRIGDMRIVNPFKDESIAVLDQL